MFARARLQLVPRGRAGGVVAGKGWRSCRSVGLVRPTSSQGQESVETCKTPMLRFLQNRWSGVYTLVRPPLVLGPEQSQAMDSAGG